MSFKKEIYGTKSIVSIHDGYILKVANRKKVAASELNNEISILKQLRDTGFTLCGEILDYEESHYIKMTRIQGQPLSELILNSFNLRNPKKRSPLAHSLGSTLTEFYSSGIHHNDLATTNIIFEQQTGLVYLIDFGRASIDGSVSGDLGYLLDSIVKIRCRGGLIINVILLTAKCRLFIEVFRCFSESKGWAKQNKPLGFCSVLLSFIQFQIFILSKRKFSILHKLMLVPIIFIVPTICILLRYYHHYFSRGL